MYSVVQQQLTYNHGYSLRKKNSPSEDRTFERTELLRIEPLTIDKTQNETSCLLVKNMELRSKLDGTLFIFFNSKSVILTSYFKSAFWHYIYYAYVFWYKKTHIPNSFTVLSILS